MRRLRCGPAARGDPATGHHVLGLLFVLTLALLWNASGDWVHLLWSVQYPLAGLWLGAGLLLVRVWPDDRRERPALLRGWNGAVVALLALLVLGSVPVLLTSIPATAAGRVSGSPLAALLEAARYGFDGTLPASMQPEQADQIERGLGHPPRSVTVTMGSTLLAAGAWILFVALALAGRAIPAGGARRAFFCLAPLVLAPATTVPFPDGAWDRGIWDNQPRLVMAYGPVLAAAAVAAVVLAVAGHLDGKAARQARDGRRLDGER